MTNKKSHSQSTSNNSNAPSMTKLSIISWNCNRRNDPCIIQSLIKSKKPDIVHIQEPQDKLTDPNSIIHKNFANWLQQNNYSLLHVNEFIITIINSNTLDQHYSSPIHVSKNKRAATAVFYLDSIHPLLVSNVYSPHQKHDSYKQDTTTIKTFIQHVKDQYPGAEHLIAGDINIDESNTSVSQYNVLNFLKRTLNLKSVIPSFYQKHHPTEPLPPTHHNHNGSESHIDHILASDSRFTQHCTSASINSDFITTHANSDHDPISATFTFAIAPSIEPEHTPSIHRHYNQIAAIQVVIPKIDDEDAKEMNLEPGWYHPDLIHIEKQKRDPSLEIMQELHKASDQTDFTLLTDSLDRATTILFNHAQTVPTEEIGLTLPPRTTTLQNEINTCYDLFNTLLNDTITKAFNNIATNKSKRKLTHYNLQVKISDLYLTNIKTITRLIDINQGNPKKRRQRFKKAIAAFKNRHNHLLVLYNEQKDRCQKLIDNYTETATDIDIHRQAKRLKPSKDAQTSLPGNSHQTQTTDNTPASAMPTTETTPPSTKAQSQKIQPAMTLGNHKRQKETITTLRSAFKKIHSHLNAIQTQFDNIYPHIRKLDDDYTLSQRTQLLRTQIQPRYQALKSKINDTLTVYNSAHLNYNASFGQPKDLAKSIHQKVDPPLRANTHIPISQGPHVAPKLIPAIGAAERLQATKETQQMQMEAPPGKALHFVDIRKDEVGPAGINVDLTKPFTRDDLSSYHPAAEALDEATQHEIIEAHNRFQSLITPLQIDTDNKQPYKWPFNFVTDPQTRRTRFKGPIPDLEQLARPTPSKARLNNFTINVLARMPRCWLVHLTTIIQIILASRIIPTKLKTCGRILIDKPGTTDKRPISILHAIDAILDSTVASSLSSTLEEINLFDDSILAYRKGRSSTDAVLNHLITVQDIASQQMPQSERRILAQFDLDQEKFFDRLTTELQLLPFHIAGFPDLGYIEWLAESLSGTIIITSTPFGKVECFFRCGTRQGATLSTITANMVGWLISIPWDTPHPNLGTSAPGHILQATNDHPLYDEQSLTHDQQTYCDDASKYIVSNDKDIYHYLDHVLLITSTMSIVTKLSINADKSNVRITGLDPNRIRHRPSLTVWHHRTKSVKKTLIRTINMSSQPDSYLYKMFGVLINKHGTPAKKHHTTLPQVRALTQSWKVGTISDRALVNHYPLYVTSVCNFAALAKGFSLYSCRSVDHTTIESLLVRHFHLHPSIDSIHNIILPTKMAGFHFTGFLTTTVLDAYCRELLVLSNNPFPETLNIVTARFTQAIQNCYHAKSHTDDHLCPNAINQIALAGFYLRPTSMPIANAIISCVADAHPHHTPFGQAAKIHVNDQHPFDHVLQKDNIQFSTHSKMYQDCIHLLRQTAAKPPETTSILPQYNQLLNETQNYPSSYNEPLPHEPWYHTYQYIRPAITSIIKQQQILLQFFSPPSVLTVNEYPPQPFTNYLRQNAPLPLESLSRNKFEWQYLDDITHDANAFFRQATESTRTPDTSTYPEYPRSEHIQHMHLAMRHALNTYESPIILSGDSSNSSKSPLITAVTFLVAINFKKETLPDWTQDIPIPLYYKAHILPPKVGTMPTTNNMGEIHAATIALNTAPYDHPIIIILDSKVTLYAIFLFFFPSTLNNREHIRQTFPSNNIYYVSELHEALHKHWRHSISLERLARQTPSLETVITNFHHIASTLQQNYGEAACLDIKQWQLNHQQPAPWSDSIKVLQYDNILFTHVKSHQLTEKGNPKTRKTKEGNEVQIKVQPNRLFALMNSYADNICSRITKDPMNHSELPIPIPQPPITRLQNVIYHNGSIVTQPIKAYIDNLLYNHALSRLQLHPLSWHLDLLPHLHDPGSTIATSDIRKEIVTTRAISHYRLLLTNEAYKTLWQQRTKPDTPLMDTCPFCTAPNNSTADQFHHHYACTNKDIKGARDASLDGIRQAASHIQSILHAIHFLLRPALPASSSQNVYHVLLSALTTAEEAATYTEEDKHEIRQTGRLPARLQPTAELRERHPSINEIYTNPPSPTQKSSFNFITTLPMTGLLPNTAHTIIQQYTTELITLTHHLYPRHRHQANEIELINSKIPAAWQITTTSKTLLAALKQAWQQLFTTMHQHPVQMQTKITKTILKKKDSIAPPPPKPKRKRSNSKKRKRAQADTTPTPANNRKPCQAIRCHIRSEQGLDPTPSATITCPECKTYNEANEAAGKCIKLLQGDISSLVQSLRTMIPPFDIIDPTNTTIDEAAVTLSTTTVDIRDLSAAIQPQLPAETTENIHKELNILPYQPEDGDQLEEDQLCEDQLELNQFTTTTLQFIAVTLLLQLHPSSPPEFPPSNTPHTAKILLEATTLCRCHPFHQPTQNPTRQLCDSCSHLIQCAPMPNLTSNQTLPQCITCGEIQDTYQYPDKPCLECMTAALLHRNRPLIWHRKYTNDLKDTITNYFT